MTSQHNLKKSQLHKTQGKPIQRLIGIQCTCVNTQDIQDLKQQVQLAFKNQGDMIE